MVRMPLDIMPVLSKTQADVIPTIVDVEWDINVPETKPSKIGGAAGEFVMAAVTGLSKYGTPVSRTVG